MFGIFRPILPLPQGITDRLTPTQWKAILTHELCHVRRRDNLTAAIHMAIEAIFWFHPLVWWIGKRLVDERERACDEEVLLAVGNPEAYAEGKPPKVCRIYLESPLPCVSGNHRIRSQEASEGNHDATHSSEAEHFKKTTDCGFGILAIGGPILFGLANSPQGKAQSQAAAPSRYAFDVASIRTNTTFNTPSWMRFDPAGVNIQRVALIHLIATAYRTPESLISTDERMRELFASRYDIVAKAGHEVPRDQLLVMLQTVLTDRFRLTLHRESHVHTVYKLVIAKGGPKLNESKGPQPRDTSCALPKCMAFSNIDMSTFAEELASRMGRTVLDFTGLQGSYDFTLRLDSMDGQASDDPAMKASISDWSLSSIFSDIEKQLGLKLESTRAPVESLVIDHVEPPSEN